MKIYGHFMSSPANQTRLTASALGLDFDYTHVDLATGQHKTPDYLAINPVGKVPALDDDGFYLSESNAICRYLAGKAGSDLYPADAQSRAKVDQWMEFASHHLRANVTKVLFYKVFAKMLGAPSDPKAIEEGMGFVAQQLPLVDAALDGNDYLVGGKLSLADVAVLAALEPLELIEYDVNGHGALKAWRQKLMGESWYTAIHDHFAAELQAA